MKLIETRWNLWNIISGNRKTKELKLQQDKTHLQNKLKHASTLIESYQCEKKQAMLRNLQSRLKMQKAEHSRIKSENIKMLKSMGSSKAGPYHPKNVTNRVTSPVLKKPIAALNRSASLQQNCRENTFLLRHITDITFRKSKFQVYSDRIAECPRLKRKFQQEQNQRRRVLSAENTKLVKVLSQVKPTYSVDGMKRDYERQTEYSARISQNSHRMGNWGDIKASPSRRPQSARTISSKGMIREEVKEDRNNNSLISMGKSFGQFSTATTATPGTEKTSKVRIKRKFQQSKTKSLLESNAERGRKVHISPTLIPQVVASRKSSTFTNPRDQYS